MSSWCEYDYLDDAEALAAAGNKIDELEAIIGEQQRTLEALCEGTDGSTPALVTIARLEATIAELREAVRQMKEWEKAGKEIVDFVHGQKESQRPDVFHLSVERMASLLEQEKGDD